MTTHEDSKPANNSSVHLVVYGEDGKTDPIILTDLEGEKKEGGKDDDKKKKKKRKDDGKDKGDKDQQKEHNYFEPGKTDEFDVS